MLLNDTPTIPPVLFVVRLAIPFDPNVELNEIVSLFEYEAPVFEDKDTALIDVSFSYTSIVSPADRLVTYVPELLPVVI